MGRIGQLDTKVFARVIRMNGVGQVPLKWFRYAGPCPRAHNQASFGQDWTADPTCPLCGNTSLLWEDLPIPTDGLAQGKIAVYQQAAKRKKDPQKIETGVLQINYLEDDYPFAEGDRIILDRRYGDFAELIAHSGTADRLRYPPAVSILSVYGPNGKITTGYSLANGGIDLQWDNSMAGGGQYTVRYRYRPSWVVSPDDIHHRPQTEDGEFFPSHALLKLYQNIDSETKEGQIG